MQDFVPRFKKVAAEATPRAFRTIWWIFRITATVSFAMFLLKYTGILYWVAALVSPVFGWFGLPGSAAMAYVSGYFINVYSCIAVLSTLELTAREITILGAMSLAAHAIPVESAVQRKTGTSPAYTVVVRTLGSLALGFGLNLVLPGRPEAFTSPVALSGIPFFQIQGDFWPLLGEWALGLLKLTVWMTCLIYLLNLIQRALYEFGIMEHISKWFRPLMRFFGLSDNATFLWIVANVIGLSYGSAAILDEMDRGNLSPWEVKLLNTHIGISHSNFEDLLLFSAIGGAWYVILLSRWLLVTALVWIIRGWKAIG